MAKLLVVDDEEIILYGYKNAIAWEDNGIEIVGLAENGIQALEIIKEKNPDIVMTDVVMPKMDGIELTRQLKENYPHIKILIMSGHDEFEYARSAIENGVSKYILKPARVELILKEVLTLKVQVEEEKKLQKFNETMEEKLKESLPLLRTQYMNTIIFSNELKDEEIKEKFKYLDIHIASKNVFVMVMQFDNYAQKIKELKLEEVYVIYKKIEDICENVVGMSNHYFVFKDENENVVIINNCPQNISNRENLYFVSNKASEIQDAIRNILGETVSIGIGEIKDSLSLISEAYNEAIIALEHKFYMGNNSIVFIGDVYVAADNRPPYPYEFEEELIKAVKIGNYDNACRQLDKFIDTIKKNEKVSKEYVCEMAAILVNSIHHSFIIIDNSDSEGLEKAFLKIIKNLHEKNIETLTDIIIEIKKIIFFITNRINLDANMRKNSHIQNAIEFIRNNISKDVSLQAVANAIFISPNYLSFLFKEKFNESFKDFVIKIRVEKAEELLKTTNYKIKKIAELVGYNDWRYFTQTFKKITGKTPQEFKDNN